MANKANAGRGISSWIDAPLPEGATGYFSYARNQIGQVEVYCSVKLPTPLAQESVLLTMLPEGFRPLTASRIIPCELSHDSGSGNSIGSLRILTESGTVSVLRHVDDSRSDLDTIRASFIYIAR